MKKLFFLILFFSINILTFGANVYFLNGGQGYVYTNGQTFTSNQDGYASVAYHIWADPARYSVSEWGANFQDPDGNWSDWSHLSSGYGAHHCLKAGTWHVIGRVWVEHDIYGYGHYWMYTSFTLHFYVVDNYAPAVPQNFQASFPLNQHPVLTWNANGEDDLQGYRIYKKYTCSSGTQTFTDFTTSTSYTDLLFTADYKTGDDRAEYWIVAIDINSNISNETQHYSTDGTGPQWKAKYNNQNEMIADQFELYQNYPNPFNPSTKISYLLPEDAKVMLKVYDMLGTEVAELVNGMKSAGHYEATFDASNLSSGVYIYRITAIKNDRILFNQSKRMILLQ